MSLELEKIELEKVKTLEDALVIIKLLVSEIFEIRAENTGLKKENSLLKERIAKLERNSSNSSKPPSSDITKPKEEQRQSGKRKIGGQKDHKSNWRLKFKPEEIDKVKKLKLSECPNCKNKLKQIKEVKIYQQAELVDKPVIVTQYELQGARCKCCDKIFYPELPKGVITGQIFGPKLLALSGYMKSCMGVSISEISEFFTDVLKARISRAAVQNNILKVSEAIKPPYEELCQAVSNQAALNVDETGWKINGQKHWVWLFCNRIIALFVISKSRGCKVLEEVLGENFLGALTSDFYSAYVKYASPKQQFCLAHLIRDVKFLTTLPDDISKKFGIKLLSYMRRVFKLWHSRTLYSELQWKKKTDRFKKDLQKYLHNQDLPKHSEAHRVQRRLVKHFTASFRFLESPKVYEPTNNLAERTLRPLVRLRRMSQGSRGQAGSDWTARAASIVATCKIQNRSTWQFFQQAVNSYFFNSTAPSLIPTQQ